MLPVRVWCWGGLPEYGPGYWSIPFIVRWGLGLVIFVLLLWANRAPVWAEVVMGRRIAIFGPCGVPPSRLGIHTELADLPLELSFSEIMCVFVRGVCR